MTCALLQWDGECFEIIHPCLLRQTIQAHAPVAAGSQGSQTAMTEGYEQLAPHCTCTQH